MFTACKPNTALGSPTPNKTFAAWSVDLCSVAMTIESSTSVRVHNQPDTKSNPNPNPNLNPTTKQHAMVDIHLNIVTCLTYPDKFIRDNVVALCLLLSIVIVTLPLTAVDLA